MRDLLPFLVGELNHHTAAERYALWPHPPGCAGARLVGLLGWSGTEYLASFRRLNLCRTRWHVDEAAERAEAVQRVAEREGVDVVMLGAKVSASFLCGDLPVWGRRGCLYRVHHPSGRCRAWNDPGERLRLMREFERYRRDEFS